MRDCAIDCREGENTHPKNYPLHFQEEYDPRQHLEPTSDVLPRDLARVRFLGHLRNTLRRDGLWVACRPR
jgi:hypothetical protein